MNQGAEGPEGFGGWLLLVAIGQWLGVLRELVELIGALPTWVGQWSVLYTAIIMNMKRREFPTLLRIEAALFVVVPLLSIWWVARSTGTVVDKASFAGIATQAIAATIGASLSILYSLRSVRVRNTFIY